MKLMITADLGLREDKPRCRLDEDWLDSQRQAIRFVLEKTKEKNAELCIVGDLFEYPIVHPSVVNMFFAELHGAGDKVYLIAGNHDLPYHSWKNVNRSSFGEVMFGKEVLDLRYLGRAAHFGNRMYGNETGLYFLHEYIYKDEDKCNPWEKERGKSAQQLLDLYPKAKWIFVGDNHHKFVYKKNNRYVINPGCLLVQEADMIDYEPAIFFVDTEKGIIEEILLPKFGELITDEYLKEEKKRFEGIEAFVESVKKSGEVSLSFEDNLKKAISKNKEQLGTAVNIIDEILQEVKK